MLNYIVAVLVPLLLCLIVGYYAGKKLNPAVTAPYIASIPYLIWLMLIAVGIQLGQVLSDFSAFSLIAKDAFIFASLISLFSFLPLVVFQPKSIANSIDKGSVFKPIFDCLLAILMVSIGAALYHFIPRLVEYQFNFVLLLILTFLIGLDLAQIKVGRLSLIHWLTPLVAVLALLLAAGLGHLYFDYTFFQLIASGAGFGWYSLSGPLMTQINGADQGSFSLLTDLIREFYAIILLYLCGRSYPLSVISLSGATAMDSNLALVKNCCGRDYVPHALFSGLILTILAPIFMIVFSHI